MRPPPLPFPPGLGKLAKAARAGISGALEVLADAWEEKGDPYALARAAELRRVARFHEARVRVGPGTRSDHWKRRLRRAWADAGRERYLRDPSMRQADMKAIRDAGIFPNVASSRLTPEVYAEAMRNAFTPERLVEAMHRRTPWSGLFNLDRSVDADRPVGIRVIADPAVPPGTIYGMPSGLWGNPADGASLRDVQANLNELLRTLERKL